MTNSKNILLALVALLSCVGFAIVVGISFYSPEKVDAAAPPGIAPQVATTSRMVVGPQQNVFLFGTTTNESRYQCASRIITTAGQPIMLSFGTVSSTTLSATYGHLQAASTTIAYDASIYGCGYMTAYGYNASTSITVTETR